MASLRFYLQKKGENCTVYLQLSLGNKNVFKRKTHISCNSNLWNKEQGLPKENRPEVETKRKELKSIKHQIDTKFDIDRANGVFINSEWLKDALIEISGQDYSDGNLFDNFIRGYIADLPYKVNNHTKKRTKPSTVRKYEAVLALIIAFEKSQGRRYRVEDVDKKYSRAFVRFLSDTRKQSDNTVGRNIRYIRTFLREAALNGFSTIENSQHFKGYTVDPEIVTLSFKEIDRIKNFNLANVDVKNLNIQNLEIARGWLVIGCFTGQRISDLMRMTVDDIETIGNLSYIIITQQKTGKKVRIPLHYEVEEMIDKWGGNFPTLYTKSPDSNAAMFNKYLKILVREVGINKAVKGSVYSKKQGRRVEGEYPKYMLISSHIMRRSFATNFYSDENYPTPLLMNITAHSTEKQFLKYVRADPENYSEQLARKWAKLAIARQEDKILKVVKSASNE